MTNLTATTDAYAALKTEIGELDLPRRLTPPLPPKRNFDMTFQDQISGQRFKLINERTGDIVEDFSHLDDAQREADRLHAQMPGRDHFRVVEIVWCGGSKRLSDIDARKTSR